MTNRPKAETQTHKELERALEAWVSEQTFSQIKLKKSKPQTNESGPVRWQSNIWLDRVGSEVWPALIAVECRAGRLSARAVPRPRRNQGKETPCPLDAALARAARSLAERVAQDLKLGNWTDPVHLPPETPAQRRAREAAEARAREEAEAKPFYDIFGGEEE